MSEAEAKVSEAWRPLNQKWRTKLMSEKFVVKDCIGDGDCQFRSVEAALTNAGIKMTSSRLRNAVAKYINALPNDSFANILQTYRLEKANNEFIGHWDPYKVKNKKEFNKELKKEGFHFEGDFITLSLMSMSLKVDFIVFDDSFNILKTSNVHDKLIILYYSRSGLSGHYETIGFMKSPTRVVSVFKRQNLPEEMTVLLDDTKFIIAHLNCILQTTEEPKRLLTLNDILLKLAGRLCTKFTQSQRKDVLKKIKVWLQNRQFFASIE
jgi:hypothetical protein